MTNFIVAIIFSLCIATEIYCKYPYQKPHLFNPKYLQPHYLLKGVTFYGTSPIKTAQVNDTYFQPTNMLGSQSDSAGATIAKDPTYHKYIVPGTSVGPCPDIPTSPCAMNPQIYPFPATLAYGNLGSANQVTTWQVGGPPAINAFPINTPYTLSPSQPMTPGTVINFAPLVQLTGVSGDHYYLYRNYNHISIKRDANTVVVSVFNPSLANTNGSQLIFDINNFEKYITQTYFYDHLGSNTTKGLAFQIAVNAALGNFSDTQNPSQTLKDAFTIQVLWNNGKASDISNYLKLKDGGYQEAISYSDLFEGSNPALKIEPLDSLSFNELKAQFPLFNVVPGY